MALKINWQEDLDQLRRELPRLHKNLFYQVTEQEFCNRINDLKQTIDEMDPYTKVMGLAKIIASVGDAHTTLVIPQNNMLPIACYWFDEGIFITETMPQFQDLLHHKIIEVDDIPIAEVIEKLTEIISHENHSFVKSQLPGYLLCTDVLYGLGINYSVEEVELKVEDKEGLISHVVLPAIKYAEWQLLQSPDQSSTDSEQIPLYRKHKELHYWWEFIPEQKTLYVNYNKCKDMDYLSVKEFIESLREQMESNDDIQRLVLDYRNNGGGNSELFRPFIQWLSSFPRFNQKGRLFVIVGRDTFSSALLNTYLLKFQTEATFLGEATGGKPNCYGEVGYLKLNKSGLFVRYSTKHYHLIEEDSILSFYPDITCEVTFQNYIENRDPCMDWIIGEIY